MEEIQNIKFPDKVIMRPSNTYKRNLDLPRLDMSRVYQKYQSQSNVHIIKPIKKKETIIQSAKKISLISKKNSSFNKVSTDISKNNKINYLKNEVNQTKDIIKDLELSLEKVKKTFKENTNKETKMKENLKIADSKIETLKNQLRQYSKKDIDDDFDVFYNTIFFYQ